MMRQLCDQILRALRDTLRMSATIVLGAKLDLDRCSPYSGTGQAGAALPLL